MPMRLLWSLSPQVINGAQRTAGSNVQNPTLERFSQRNVPACSDGVLGRGAGLLGQPRRGIPAARTRVLAAGAGTFAPAPELKQSMTHCDARLVPCRGSRSNWRKK